MAVTAPVLVGLRPLGLGDFCAAVPAWKALRRAHPDHTLVLAAGRWQLPLIELCPAIDVLVDAEPLAGLPDGLIGVDIAVNLHGRGPQSTRILADLQPRTLVSFRHDAVPESADGPGWDADEHEVNRWCRLVSAAGADADPAELDLRIPNHRPRVGDATIVHVGASAESRRWPPERWIRVIRTLLADGHRIVLTGTADESVITDHISDEIGTSRVVDLAGRTSVEDLAALVADARLVLAGDTGVSHLASAYRRPSVTLFGPTPPSRWGPPADGPHRTIWTGSEGDPHGTDTDAGLLQIGVDDVLDAIDSLLRPATAPRPLPRSPRVSRSTGAATPLPVGGSDA